MKKKSKQAKQRIAQTMQSAAAMLGCEYSDVRRAKNAGSPAFTRSGRINIDQLETWLRANPRKLDDETPSIDIEKAFKKRAVRLLKEHQLALEQRKVIPIDEIREAIWKFCNALKSQLAGSRTGLAADLALMTGHEAAEIQEHIKNRDNEVLGQLHKDPWIIHSQSQPQKGHGRSPQKTSSKKKCR